MKVLQVNSVYKKGSTGKITYDIHSDLQQNGIESVVCYGRGSYIEENNVYRICNDYYGKVNNLLSRLSGIRYGGCCFSTKKLINIIKKEKPDIVHLQCINGHFVNIYKLVKWLNDHKIRTILTLHAEFMYTANCSHAYDCEKWMNGCEKCSRVKEATKTFFLDRTADSYRKMKEAFEGFENLTIVSVSDWVKNRAIKSSILRDNNHKTIFNGIDTTIFNDSHKSVSAKKRTVFHVTPMFSDQEGHNKGGSYVLELAKRMKDSDLDFVIAGKYSVSGVIPENVRLLGEIKDQNKLAELYANADVTLVTSKRETFSLVCAESLCCGTPVVGFEAGAPETVAIKEYSRFVEYGNVDELENEILDFLHRDFDKKEISVNACELYSKDTMVRQYIQEYRRLL